MKTEPEGFKEFWDVWRPNARHTDGRGLAREAFAKHIKAGANAQDIIDGARCFFRTMKDRDREFVPLSATWLNRGAYEDMAVQERAYRTKLEEWKQRQSEPSNVVSMSISPEKRAEMAEKARQIVGASVRAAQ